jgi:tRNA(fMet)-specific endonuclease VapC
VGIRLGSIVEAELDHGAHRSQQVQQGLAKVESLLRPFVSIPFEDDAAREYGRLRADLERRGFVIGPRDLPIAAIALVHGLTLVSPVPGSSATSLD